MVIIILENVPVGLRGELSRWMLEPKSGVFVGTLTARIRDLLWEKCCSRAKTGGVIQIWNTNNEQGFSMRMHGVTSRSIEEVEGLQLIKIKGDYGNDKRIKRLKNVLE
jgi:CRISPR-associated protein Cas2